MHKNHVHLIERRSYICYMSIRLPLTGSYTNNRDIFFLQCEKLINATAEKIIEVRIIYIMDR